MPNWRRRLRSLGVSGSSTSGGSPGTGSRSVRVTGVERVKEALDRAGKAGNRALARGLFQEGEKIMSEAKEEVPVDTGVLRASGHVEKPKRSKGTVVVEVGFGGPAGAGENDEDVGYALVMHEGRRPGQKMPPLDAIKAWARRKEDVDEEAAFAIARSIAEEGIEGTKYLEGPAKKHAPKIPRNVAREIRMAIEAAT